MPVTLALMLAWSTIIMAQTQHSAPQMNQPSRYYLNTDDNLLQFPVNILGYVNKPGQYMVPYRTDLITLLSLAGGFREDAKITQIKIIRNTTPNWSSASATDGRYGSRRVHAKSNVYTLNMERYFEKGDHTQIPELQPDDTILVKGATPKLVNNFFNVVGKAIMLAQLYFLVKVAHDR
jgi:protein involved in polysaccharide export with SLBB domain